MNVYKVDPLVLRQATLLTAYDKRPSADAMFVHGSCVRDDDLDDSILAMAVTNVNHVGKIVFNGISDEVCIAKTLAYPGAETWERKLRAFGVTDALKIPPSPHTPAECRNMIAFATDQGFSSIIVAAFPHHLLRVMCQWVFCLKEKQSPIKVYARTMPSVDWFMKARKPVLGGGVVEGTLFDHMEHELKQLALYADLNCFETPSGERILASSSGPEDKQKYTPNATLEELVAYYQERDQAVSA